jgi:hypothetical protein
LTSIKSPRDSRPAYTGHEKEDDPHQVKYSSYPCIDGDDRNHRDDDLDADDYDGNDGDDGDDGDGGGGDNGGGDNGGGDNGGGDNGGGYNYNSYSGDERYIVLDFEGNGDFSPSGIKKFSPNYKEDRFILSARPSDGASVDATGINLTNIDYDYAPAPDMATAIKEVNRQPGVTQAHAGESESDLVIKRSDRKDFEFKGGFFSFAAVPELSDNTQATIKLTFEGYRNGVLIDSFVSAIPVGNFIESRLDSSIDKLVIKDGDLNGWTLFDNLKFEI